MTLPVNTAEIAERFLKGASVQTLAQAYGCSRGTVLYRLNKSGVRSRTRSRVNARSMLTVHRPVLVGLLHQLEKTLDLARDRLVGVGGDIQSRSKALDRIFRLQGQIHALEAITAPIAKRVNSAQVESHGSV